MKDFNPIMEPAVAIAVVASVTLAANIMYRVFTGGRATGSVGARLNSIENTLFSLQDEIKKLTDILLKIADMKGEIGRIEIRVSRSEADIRDLRRGRGFIQEEIKGEYPRFGTEKP